MRPTVRKFRQRKTISVAAVQPAIVEEIDVQRLARVERLLAEVEKANLVLLPELWRVGYSDFTSYSKEGGDNPSCALLDNFLASVHFVGEMFHQPVLLQVILCNPKKILIP